MFVIKYRINVNAIGKITDLQSIFCCMTYFVAYNPFLLSHEYEALQILLITTTDANIEAVRLS